MTVAIDLSEKLSNGLATLGLKLSPETQQKMLDYLALLAKWNKVHNLTAVRELDDMVTLHLLDSLAVLPHLTASNVLDVGSGGGLPGIPLALALPELQVTVVDSSHKKATFLRQAKAELGLDNVQVVCERVEAYQPEIKFHTIISRAFSDVSEFVRLTQHLLEQNGMWLAMKGVYPYDELAQTTDVTSTVQLLTIPGLDAQRHLVKLNRVNLSHANTI
ncbi:MAG: 16S rRNA (guanine(527)-N(7))-methyltransferase RsmG [Methylophilales bacterium]|nr:16S rRNA (guanine(527)-N(7))-methyltransferase RsmG [Methylophilales bacterium]